MSSKAPTNSTSPALDGLEVSPDSVKSSDELTYQQLLLCSAAIGIAGGLIASLYYFVLEVCMYFVWHDLPDFLSAHFPSRSFPEALPHPGIYAIFLEPFFPGGILSSNYLWIVATIGGLLVGLSLHFLGAPGEIASVVDDVHEPGQIDPRQSPSMIVTSLCSITAGGSLGPEAPLVQIIGSCGSWLANQLKLTIDSVRLLTLCGMSAALGAFFGAPLGGAIFALEIPHRRGIEFYEALVPAVVSATLSFAIFRFSTGMTAAGIYHFPVIESISLMNLLQGALLGSLGALLAAIFTLIFRGIGYLSESIADHKILLATLGGLCIGLIALMFPQTLFFSEMEVQSIIVETGPELGIKLLLLIALAKMLAISCTVHAGLRGGFIFPLFFVGAAVGLALSLAIPQLHPTVAMLCMMAALNIAITKTPVSTTIILTAASGSAMVPVLVMAGFTSLILTPQLSIIRTQRSRFEQNSPGVGCPKQLLAKV